MTTVSPHTSCCVSPHLVLLLLCLPTPCTLLAPLPRRLPPGFVAWIWAVYKYDEDHLIEVAGLDSATYMRILTFCECTPRSASRAF